MAQAPRFYDPEQGERNFFLPMQLGPGGSFGSGGVTAQAAGGANPAITGADVVMATITIPAGAFALPNDGLEIMALGTFANNANTKTVKIIINPTTAVVGTAVSGGVTIASLTWATAGANIAYNIEALVFKTGTAGSNTQQAYHQQAQVAATTQTLAAPQTMTMTESSAIIAAITINATTTVTDATWWAMSAVPLS